jgi:16S rRNA A1518/A1519 N6-dimethyltransferase RsmA/KsgA/DIM1 with predicted DNA glycosylase/AP lyase activity
MGITNIDIAKIIRKRFLKRRRMLREAIKNLSQNQKILKNNERNRGEKEYGAWQITTLLIAYAELKGKDISHSLQKWGYEKYFFGE